MRIAMSVGNRKLIFAMISRHNLSGAVATMHLNKAGEATTPSTIVNERNPEARSKPRGKA